MELDITDTFTISKEDSITEKDIENYIEGLIGLVFETLTHPLKIRIDSSNKIHVIKTNIKLNIKQKDIHFRVLQELDRIIRNSFRIDRDGTVILSHNTSIRTLRHKQKVIEYVYFNSLVKIKNKHYIVELSTERLKNQNPNILSLYNVRAKKKEPEERNSIITLSPNSTDSLT